MSPAVTVSQGQKRLEALLPKLEEARAFESKQWPVRSNYASKIGHTCERYLYYLRHDWEKADKKDWKGIGILGNLLASWWSRYMSEKGYILTHGEVSLNDEIAKKYQIGGRIDGRIGWGSDTKPLLYEFKTMNERYYSMVNTYEDFKDSKADWIKGYPAQLQIYMLSENEEAGLFILCNKATLEWKAIPVYLDYEYTEWLLQRVARVNKANDSGTPPERISYCKTCERCEFKKICLPDIVNEELPLIDNDDLELKLLEREKLKPSVERYIELDDDSKELAKKVGKDFIVNESFKVEVKKTVTTRVDLKSMPIEIKSKYEKESETVRVNFVPLVGKTK